MGRLPAFLLVCLVLYACAAPVDAAVLPAVRGSWKLLTGTRIEKISDPNVDRFSIEKYRRIK